jgi:hypothetical protein
MKPVQLPIVSILLNAAALAQTPETYQRITSAEFPTVSYDIGVTGADQSFSIGRGGAQRIRVDASGNVTVLSSLTVNSNLTVDANLGVNGTLSANAFAGSAISGGSTGLTLNAGGTNQNIALVPSGTGSVLISSAKFGLGAGVPNRGLDFKNGNWILSNSDVSANSYFNAGSDNGLIATAANQTALSVFNANTGMTGTVFKLGSLRGSSASYWLLQAYHGNGTTNAFSTQVFGIRGDGRVGIGTSAPETRLHVAGATKISDSTVSTSSSTGALVVTGGAGVGGNMNVAGKIGIGLNAGESAAASLHVKQDARIQGNLIVDGSIHLANGNVVADSTSDVLHITSDLQSTGYGTGALTVAGGVGIAKNLNVGGTINAIGGFSVAGQQVWHSGNFDPAQFLQSGGGVADFSVSGVLSGGGSGLTLHSGSANNTIRLVTTGTGRVEIANTLAITETTGIQYLLMGNQDGGGMANPVVLRAFDGDLQIGSGNSWSGQGGTFTANVTFTDDGKVGIGTANPGFPLTIINGSSTAPQVAFGPSETAAVRMIAGATGDFALNPQSGRMVINGLVDGAAGSNPIGRLEIRDGATPFGSGDYGLVVRARTAAPNAGANLLAVGNNAASGWEQFVIKGNGTALFGTTTDSSNGRIQLAGHTTRAGGVAWGDTYLYRNNTGKLFLGDGTTDAVAIESRWTGQASGHAGIRGISTSKDFHVGTSTGRALLFDVGTTSKAELTTSQFRLLTGVPLRVEDATASTSTGTGALRVTGGVGVGGQLTAGTLYSVGSATFDGFADFNGLLNVDGPATFNQRLRVLGGDVRIGTDSPLLTTHIYGNGLAVTSDNRNPRGAIIHLADYHPSGAYGVQIAGRDSGNGHDLVAWTRVGPNDPFAESFTVKSTGETRIPKTLQVNTTGAVDGGIQIGSPTAPNSGRLEFLSTANRYRIYNDQGVLKIADNANEIGELNREGTLDLDGRLKARAVTVADDPLHDYDAATKKYVDENSPFSRNAAQGFVFLDNGDDKLGIGWSEPAAKLHVVGQTAGMIARFSPAFGGVPSQYPNRSFIRLDNQNPGFFWEFSSQDAQGQGSRNGLAIRQGSIPGVSGSKTRLFIGDDGRLGIGTTTPSAPFEIRTDGYHTDALAATNLSPDQASLLEFPYMGGAPQMILTGQRYEADQYILFRNSWNSETTVGAGMAAMGWNDTGRGGGTLFFATLPEHGLEPARAPIKRMIISPEGNVGIGTGKTEGAKLSVEGRIRAREVIVNTTTWADDVFAPGYSLAPLQEVENHVKRHQRLPDVPSASEVAEVGVNVGEMQSILLRKVEELTLHLISQEKRIAKLEEENESLRAAARE